ncbi:uncharacterized protein LOC141594826 [Silene latifolia]|uniref:uncharacterized protein LOC141594826 n=1 Tax=Silene latifolia TaxID=37657 RepID=UPI003D76B91A
MPISFKGTDFWQFHPTAAHFWFWTNVVTCRDCLISIAGTIENARQLLDGKDYKSQVYDLLRKKSPPFPMHNTLNDSFNYPKHTFIKLPTVENLCKRGMLLVNRCVLCESQAETTAYLFFKCTFSASVWTAVATWIGASSLTSLSRVLAWFKCHKRGKSWAKRQRRCALLTVIYLLWKERNAGIFQDVHTRPSALVWKAKYYVLLRSRSQAVAFEQLANCSN